jgi:signal transduction histidine kinase
MLAAGRVESEPAVGPLADIALAELLRASAAAVCMSYRVPAETVQLDLAPCLIRAWPLDLEIIFRNLIDNAVKYAGTPPRVAVTARCGANQEVLVQVADNGRGIPYHLRRKIFGRFVRLGSELEREKPGTGLGLYIVRTLLRRLRGSIRVRDPKQGPGAVFEVRLPGRPANAETLAPP